MGIHYFTQPSLSLADYAEIAENKTIRHSIGAICVICENFLHIRRYFGYSLKIML